jgi:hypothetical protein
MKFFPSRSARAHKRVAPAPAKTGRPAKGLASGMRFLPFDDRRLSTPIEPETRTKMSLAARARRATPAHMPRRRPASSSASHGRLTSVPLCHAVPISRHVCRQERPVSAMRGIADSDIRGLANCFRPRAAGLSLAGWPARSWQYASPRRWRVSIHACVFIHSVRVFARLSAPGLRPCGCRCLFERQGPPRGSVAYRHRGCPWPDAARLDRAGRLGRAVPAPTGDLSGE